MSKSNVQELFASYDEQYQRAMKELLRPSHAVVAYAVCASVREALYGYLTCLYMLHVKEHNGIWEQANSVDDLLVLCRKHDEELNKIDFSPLYCQQKNMHDEDRVVFCQDLDTIKECARLTEKVRTLVHKKLDS